MILWRLHATLQKTQMRKLHLICRRTRDTTFWCEQFQFTFIIAVYSELQLCIVHTLNFARARAQLITLSYGRACVTRLCVIFFYLKARKWSIKCAYFLIIFYFVEWWVFGYLSCLSKIYLFKSAYIYTNHHLLFLLSFNKQRVRVKYFLYKHIINVRERLINYIIAQVS